MLRDRDRGAQMDGLDEPDRLGILLVNLARMSASVSSSRITNSSW